MQRAMGTSTSNWSNGRTKTRVSLEAARNCLRRPPRGERKTGLLRVVRLVIDDTIELYEQEGRPPPELMSGRGFVYAMQRIA